MIVIILKLLILVLILLVLTSSNNSILYSNSTTITPHWTLFNITPNVFCIKHHNTIATRVPYAEAPCMLTHSPIDDNDNITTMQKKNFFFFNDWGCLFNADQPHHAVVKFNKMVR